jgi:hypothetical protein
MAEVPVPLEAVGVKSYSELLALPTAEVVRRLDDRMVVPLHEGDAFLAVLVLSGVGELSAASKRLERATYVLLFLTVVLIVLTIILVTQ